MSENLADLVGVPWQEALGRPLAELLGTRPAEAVARSASAFGDLRERNPVEITLDVAGPRCRSTRCCTGSRAAGRGRPATGGRGAAHVVAWWSSWSRRTGRAPSPSRTPTRPCAGTIGELNRASSLQELYDITAQAVRTLTGFDRVMVYRYDAEYNGEVVAEAKAEQLNSFLGLHYPASDIPAQARALYEKNWIRLISDVDYTPAPLRRPDQPSPSARRWT